jgi:hypothetical protein
MMEVGYLEGSALGGAFGLKGNLSLRDPMKYEAELSATQVDLAEVSRVLEMLRDDGKPRLRGRAVARVAGQGQLEGSGGDALASISARGSVQVTDGDFWSSKLLDRLLSHVRIARDALTAGEAAAVFDIRDRKVQLHQAAISSTALGVQGSGTIGLDGGLDLNMIVAPLGDWRQRIKESGIPLVSDVAGEIAGVIQKIVNTATSQLLYEFRVSGKVGDPQVSAVPAPLLTESAADIFGLMLRETKADKLVEAIEGKSRRQRAEGRSE